MSLREMSYLEGHQEEAKTNEYHDQPANSRTSLLDNNPELAEVQGNNIGIKTKKIFRIGFVNINGVTHTARNPKNSNIKTIINTYNFDHFGLAETNCNWSYVEEENKWHERVRPWWKKSKCVLAHNHKDISKEIKQPGGVLNMTIGEATSSIIASGKDERLGRWVWVTLKGKLQMKTTIITGYRPCKNIKDENSTYNQHLRVLAAQHVTGCPRQLWLEDMKKLIQQKLNDGHQIVLLADMNQDVKDPSITTWAEDTGLHEVVSQTTPYAVPTSQRGSRPIDGIFTSLSLDSLQSGYFPFGEIQSDHRILWIDFSYDSFFGFRQPESSPTNIRRLQCQVPHIRQSWTRHYKNFLHQNNLIYRQLRLERELATTGYMTNAMKQKFDKILQQRKEGLAYADNKCRRVFCGKVPFSPEFEKAAATIRVWKAASTIKRGCKYSSSLFRRQEKSLGLQHCLRKSLQEIKAEEDKAWKEYWNVKKQATKLRKGFLMQKAEEISEESETHTTANVYKQLIQREKQREEARKIKGTLKRLRKLAVTSVEVEQADGSMLEINEKEQLELACIAENDKKYSQTNNTICMTEPWRTLLGKTGTTAFCDSILAGTAELPDDTPIYTRELFQQLRQVHPTQNTAVNHGITEEEFKEGWKLMKEKTASASLTGLHFGHLKTCAMDASLTAFESSLANIPFSTGYSPQQWQESVIVMIKKKANLNNISALRSVVLTEADFNFNNKILGRRTINHAEKINDIAPEQYGSRKGKSACDQALHKTLTYDIMRQTKKPGALCSNDAKSCYDRILHSIVGLAYRRLGVASPPVECMLESIQNMKHHIKTSQGISTITLSKRNTLIPYQGILQGNGAAPTTWVIISTPLLNMLRAAGNGAKFESPLSHEQSHIVGFAFVDDTDLVAFDMTTDDARWNNVEQEMQDAINRWEGGLKSTGGAIVPEKSWVYSIDFTFDNQGNAAYKLHEDIQPNFSVLDKDNVRVHLTNVQCSTGKETLGVVLAPDGNSEDGYKTLLKKAQQWTAYMKAGHLVPSLAWMATNTTIMKGLEYPLPAMTLSEKQCAKIMTTIKQGLLPKAQISKSIPEAVLYGPIDDGGMGLHHLYHTQGLLHIDKFVKHIASNSITGKLLRVTVELAQLEIGIGRQLFSLDYCDFECLLEVSWIKSLWKFAYDNEITIINRITSMPLPQREGDVFLMEAFQAQGYTNNQLKMLNNCRKFLQVMTLADITTGSGDALTEHYLCKKEHKSRNSYIWPYQPEPTTKMKKFWKKAVKKTFGLKQGKLSHRLGRWLHNQNADWEWFYDPTTRNIYQQVGSRWKLWQKVSTRGIHGRTSKYKFHSNCIATPRRCQKATVSFFDNTRIILTGYAECMPSSITSVTNNIKPNDFPIKILHTNLSTERLIQSLHDKQVHIVCDGSYFPEEKVGAAAWIIEDKLTATSMSGAMPTVGHKKIQNSCRSELMGLYWVFLHLHIICTEHNIQDGAVEIHCDGLNALQKLEMYRPGSYISGVNFDIVNAITAIRDALPLTITFHHVKGHQDKGSAYENLSRVAQLNVLVDSMAKEEAKLTLQSNEDFTNTCLPFSPCDVFIKTREYYQEKINSSLIKTMREAITGKPLREYWIQKHHLETTHNNIDWETRKTSIMKLPKNRQRWLSKFATGFCGTGKMLKIYKWQTHTKCPRCLQDNETTEHVLRCQGEQTQEIWESELPVLELWMKKNNIHSELISITTHGIKAWLENDIIQITPSNRHLQRALCHQQQIGWFNFILGFWSKNFLQCQQEHLQQRNSEKSPYLLLASVQRKIWKIAWDIWEHRNKFLHETNHSYHPTEKRAIDKEIAHEWEKQLDGLPRQYLTLFHGTLQQKHAKSHTAKLKWLTTIWTLREMVNPNYFTQVHHDIDPMTRHRYLAWKDNL